MVVSIDIGTSYSSICMLGLDGKAHPVDISTGASMFGSKFSLPSAVFVEDSGNVVVGQAALNSRKRKPQNFYMGFKRNLGENIPILLGERSFRPEELYIELFRHMKARAEEVSGERVEKAFLTYPASYGKQRKDKLCAAARTAGLFDLELVDEPTAAAMCYCAEGYVKDGQTLLVYDFGGGTFDVSLLRYENGGFELLAEPVGLERCGGMDIDYLIASDMREAINKELPGTWDELQKNERRFQRLTSQLSELAVKAKHHLSSAGVFEDYLTVDLDDVNYQITVERFNGMIAPLVGQTIQTCRRALDEAQVSLADVSAVLMVGGTSRIPLVKEMAKKIAGKPTLCAADLELAVAQGALVHHKVSNQPGQIGESISKRLLGLPQRLVFPDVSDKEALYTFYREHADVLVGYGFAVKADQTAVYKKHTLKQIVFGSRYDDDSVFLRTDWTAGLQSLRKLPQGWDHIVTVLCDGSRWVGLREDGTIVTHGIEITEKQEIESWTNIHSISGVASDVVALRTDGSIVTTNKKIFEEVYGWTDIVAVSRGLDWIVGLRADGTAVAAGKNAYGQCNVQDWTDIVTISCGLIHTVGLRADGTAVATGQNHYGQCNVQDWTDVVAISCGNLYTLGLRADGTVLAVGDNSDGGCNIRECRDIIAIRSDGSRSYAIQKDGTVLETDFEIVPATNLIVLTLNDGKTAVYPLKARSYKLF